MSTNRDPRAPFLVTESRHFEGLPSLRPHPSHRNGDESLQEYLFRMGFKPGDNVVLSIDHSTRILYPQGTPPAGTLGKRRSRGKR